MGNILTYYITVWNVSSSAPVQKTLQGVIKAPQKKIDVCPLPSLEDITNTCYLSRAKSLFTPSHLFDLLPSGRRCRTLKTWTSGPMNTFISKAFHAINQLKHVK